MALSALGFSVMAIFVKRLGPALPQFELVFFRSFINFTLVLAAMLGLGEKLAVEARDAKLLTFRGVAGFVGVTCLFYSIGKLPLPVAMLLGWTSPAFVLLFSRLFLGEKVARTSHGASIVLAFGGLILLLNPKFGAEHWISLPLFPVAVALVGASAAGAAYVAVRAATARVGANVIVLYFTGIASLISLPLAAGDFRAPTTGQWMELLLLGIFATLGQLAMTRAYRHAPAGYVSTMSLLNAAFSAVFGWAFFEERLSSEQWAGMIALAAGIGSLTWSSKEPERG